MRLPTIFGSDNKSVQRGALSFRRERITEETARDPRLLAELLTRFTVAFESVARAIGMVPIFDTYRDRACGVAGAQITIEHKLSRVVQWRVSRPRFGAPYDLRESTNDGRVLVLASYVSGTADIEVY